jgi:murein L,D-transpeptidase YafK
MVTKILVYKRERKLELWQNGKKIQELHIGLGENAEGKKEQEGDKKTPEGEYYVCTKNQYSKFYLSLGVSYPNIEDAKSGLEKGLIAEETYQTIQTAIESGQCPPWNTNLGGEIMIHGHGGDKDWTKGCIAVEDEAMDELWEACDIGTKIAIYP